jgi:hypothetical protein
VRTAMRRPEREDRGCSLEASGLLYDPLGSTAAWSIPPQPVASDHDRWRPTTVGAVATRTSRFVAASRDAQGHHEAAGEP